MVSVTSEFWVHIEYSCTSLTSLLQLLLCLRPSPRVYVYYKDLWVLQSPPPKLKGSAVLWCPALQRALLPLYSFIAVIWVYHESDSLPCLLVLLTGQIVYYGFWHLYCSSHVQSWALITEPLPPDYPYSWQPWICPTLPTQVFTMKGDQGSEGRKW